MWEEGYVSTHVQGIKTDLAGSFHLLFWKVSLTSGEILVLAGGVITPLWAAVVTKSHQLLCPCSTQKQRRAEYRVGGSLPHLMDKGSRVCGEGRCPEALRLCRAECQAL